jgi:hypothetical protein
LITCFNWCREKPLAFYIFTNNKNERKLLIENIPCGGITCNDTIMHAGGKTSQMELNQLNVPSREGPLAFIISLIVTCM